MKIQTFQTSFISGQLFGQKLRLLDQKLKFGLAVTRAFQAEIGCTSCIRAEFHINVCICYGLAREINILVTDFGGLQGHIWVLPEYVEARTLEID